MDPRLDPLFLPSLCCCDCGVPLSLQAGLAKGSPGTLTSGTSTPCRGRRQLPQTPLTPRPGVVYRTANSSPVPPVTGGRGAGRLCRGLSEHDALLWGEAAAPSPVPVTRIGSDPNLAQQPSREAELFQDALSSHHAGRSAPRTAAAPQAATPMTTPPQAAAPQQGRGVPNGYHFALGLSGGPGSSASGPPCPRQAGDDEWC